MTSTLIIGLLAIVSVAVMVGVVVALYQAGRGVGFLIRHLASFVFGVLGDLLGIVGAILAGVVLAILAILNVLIARFSSANHYATTARKELTVMGARLWSAIVRRPLRLLFLEKVLVGVERRVPMAMAGAPGREQPVTGGGFPGYQLTGSLPSGGSGAQLFIARPLHADGTSPSAVVIKSFTIGHGSALPQVVRESRGLEAARRMGLVLESHLEDARFWYVMPYRAGEHLSGTVALLHGSSGESGLSGQALTTVIGHEIELLDTLATYHREGLWHKDVKPDNIIVEDGAVHLVDFGLVTPLASALTLTTHGTEYFRDPEMVRMSLAGARVHQVDGAKFDIYAAGAVLYFMLENTFPAHGALSRFQCESPEVLRWIVRRAMTDYESRYESAEAMLADLNAVEHSADPWSMRPAELPSLGGPRVAAPRRRSVPPRVKSTPPPPRQDVSTKGRRRPNPHQPVRATLAVIVLGVIGAIAYALVQYGAVGYTVVAQDTAEGPALQAAHPDPVGMGRFVVINDHPSLEHPMVASRIEQEIAQLEARGWRSVGDDPAAVAALAVAMRQDGARNGGAFDPVNITLRRLDLDGVLWITAHREGDASASNIRARILHVPREGAVTNSSNLRETIGLVPHPAVKRVQGVHVPHRRRNGGVAA